MTSKDNESKKVIATQLELDYIDSMILLIKSEYDYVSNKDIHNLNSKKMFEILFENQVKFYDWNDSINAHIRNILK